MRILFVAAVVTACSSPATPASDAGNDSATGSDASSCASDQDADGVCDDVDLCPTVFDPAQTDPDHDQIGWACDPSETITLPVVDSIVFSYLKVELVDDTFGTSLETCAGVNCLRVAYGVSPLGTMTVRSDSAAPEDAWLASTISNNLGVQGPYISRDERLFVSTRTLTADATGELDLAANTYAERASGEVWRRTDARLPADLVVVGTTMASNLVVPQAGQLVSLATSNGFAPSGELQLATAATASAIAIPEIDGGKYKLSRYVPATGTLDVVETAIDSLVHRQPRGLEELAYCVEKGSQAHYIGIRSGTITRAQLPFDACFGAGPLGDSFGGNWFMLGVDAGGNNDLGLAFVHGGQVSTVFAHEPRGTVEVVGDALRAVSVTTSAGATRVWVVTSTGTVVSIPSSLTKAKVSAAGNTVHIVGVQAGNVVLIRYRVGSGIETTQVSTALSTTTPNVSTTYEGAALVTAEDTRVVPSTSMTPATLALHPSEILVSVRGTSTVLLAAPVGFPAQKGVYVYDELAGPRITSLSPASYWDSLRIASLDDDRMSEWFVYGSPLQIARVRYTGTTPSLDAYPIGNDASIRIAGRRQNGDFVALTFGGVYIVNDAGATQVARAIDTPTAIVDAFASPPVILGWSGTDTMGPYVCLASHPERCWAGSGSEHAVRAVGDGSFGLVSVERTSSAATFTVIRPIGTGNRAQPL